MIDRIKQRSFLFAELAKRDIQGKYKGTVLGMLWSILSPLATLLIMRLVFTNFFGSDIAHFTVYLFCGNIVFSYFCDAAGQGMTAIVDNAGILTHVNAPKILFLLSKNLQAMINFLIMTGVLLFICLLDGVTLTWRVLLLLYPIVLLPIFLVGLGMILSALYVHFRDIQYIWGIFTTMLMYVSAIFYSIDRLSPALQRLFFLNPVYLFIRYFRLTLIDQIVPSLRFHLLLAFVSAASLGLGCILYKKYSRNFIYKL